MPSNKIYLLIRVIIIYIYIKPIQDNQNSFSIEVNHKHIIIHYRRKQMNVYEFRKKKFQIVLNFFLHLVPYDIKFLYKVMLNRIRENIFHCLIVFYYHFPHYIYTSAERNTRHNWMIF